MHSAVGTSLAADTEEESNNDGWRPVHIYQSLNPEGKHKRNQTLRISSASCIEVVNYFVKQTPLMQTIKGK